MSNNDDTIPHYEICVYCGQVTNVLWDTPIDIRKNYIHGCGQLCEKCGGKLERESRPGPGEVSDSELARLMNTLRKDKGD